MPLIELFADREIMEAVLGETIPLPDRHDRQTVEAYMDRVIQFFYLAGYDYVTVNAFIDLPRNRLVSEDTAVLKREQRVWDDENSGPIQTWEDFERYPFPRLEDIDYSKMEYTATHLPDGMQMIYLGPGGQFENMASLMGLATLSVAIHDTPDLVEAVANRVGELLTAMFATAATLPGVGALWLGDDLGYKTSTLISPHHLRKYVFPWQKRLAEIAHAHNLPFLLHSCGNLERIVDDLIDDVKIDARHSFEDVILPVTEAKKRYGSRIAILGGIDMDKICRYNEEALRAYTRSVLEQCAPGGGYALGTGNTVANYIPVNNYLAMLDEGMKFRYA
ncbi:MAG TPA: uroporphyrinogen decarboxylase family protein [Anaerolineaceae bacterium]